MGSVSDDGRDDLRQAHPEHVIELRELHDAVGRARAPLVELAELEQRHQRPVSPKLFHELLDLLRAI